MRRIVSAREQAEMLSPWRKTADDDFMAGPTTSVAPSPDPVVPSTVNQPPTMTNIPREEFDNVLASKGVTYDQHLDNLESHFNAATSAQKRRGRVWYRAGGDILSDIGKKFNMSTNRAIAMAAALSSRTDWNNNLHYAAHMAGKYRPGENEDEWRRANIHPSALARYMEERHGIVPGEKHPDDPTNPAHFSIKELKALHKDGYMPRTRGDFNILANKHGGNHWQYNPDAVDPQTGKKGLWANAPLRGFEELQTDEGREAWLNNAEMSVRGDTQRSPDKWNPVPRRKKGEPEPPVEYRRPWEDAVDGHMRQVRDSTSPFGFLPTSAYTGAGVPTLGGNVDKAKLLRTVDENDFDKHLNGQKYKAFFANLGNKLGFRQSSHPDDQGYYDLGGKHWTELDPELLRSTVDTQHMRAASQPHGSLDPVPGYSKSSVVTEPQYEVYQQGLIDLTHRINSKLPQHKHLLPHQVQAIIWGKFKDDQKSSAGQTYWSPTMDDIIPFADRYSRFLTAEHVHPQLLEPPASDPFLTDSDEWFDAAMDSWERLHQHELVGPGMADPRDPLLAAVGDALSYSASVIRRTAAPSSAIYLLLPHWDPESCADILHAHHAAAQGRTAAPKMDQQWDNEVMDAARQGGFTLHDHVGDGPTEGYMVSLYKDSEFSKPMTELTPEHVRNFVAQNSEALGKPHHYLGGWLQDGKFYLDVSVHIPDINRATAQAVRNQQLGIYDLNRGRTIHTEEAGYMTGSPAVLGSRNRGRNSPVPPPAQGRPGSGGRHSEESRRTAAAEGRGQHRPLGRDGRPAPQGR